MARKRKKHAGRRHGPLRRIRIWWRKLPVGNGWLALGLLNIAVFMTGLESAYVQTVTTYQSFSWKLLNNQSF